MDRCSAKLCGAVALLLPAIACAQTVNENSTAYKSGYVVGLIVGVIVFFLIIKALYSIVVSIFRKLFSSR